MSEPTGMVVNIQHFCTDDGPGIRTTVFLKGCSNRCSWCSNPETIRRRPELAYNPARCLGTAKCGRCLNLPGHEAAFYAEGPDEPIAVNWDLAHECGPESVAVCPTGALYVFGRTMTVNEVLDEVEQDGTFYEESGGGITLSGGECLLQPEFCAALLAGAHERGFTTAIETAGNVPWDNMAAVLPHVDVMLHDHKITDDARHLFWIGTHNTRILENFARAYREFPDVRFIARTPVIPGVNDDEDHIRAVLEFILPHPNVVAYQLLPYHRFGESKYGFLGKIYALEDFTPPTEEVMAHLNAIIDQGFRARESGELLAEN